jgi:hypothetical protein
MALKKIILPLFSLFLAYRSFEIVRGLMDVPPGRYDWIGAIIISFLLCLFMTGVFAFVGFAYPTSRLLPNTYYRIKNAARLKLMYKVLGVEHFKQLLLVFFWGRKKNRKKYFDGTRKGFQNFIFQTRQSEFGHLGAFCAIAAASAILLTQGHVLIVLLATGINIIGNVYPIILQRSHRMRVAKITKHRL